MEYRCRDRSVSQNLVDDQKLLEIIPTPFRAPQAHGVAEQFVRPVRSACFDWLLILNDQHRERVLDAFADHDNGHRPHRALGLKPPYPTRVPGVTANSRDDTGGTASTR